MEAAHILEVALRSTDGTDDLSARRIHLNYQSNIIIGRSRSNEKMKASNNNLYIDSPVVSRDHAVLTLSEVDGVPKVYVEDTKSTHGTKINNVILPPKKKHQLKDGDVLTLGISVTKDSVEYKSKSYVFESKPPLVSDLLDASPAKVYSVPDYASSYDEGSESGISESELGSSSSEEKSLLLDNKADDHDNGQEASEFSQNLHSDPNSWENNDPTADRNVLPDVKEANTSSLNISPFEERSSLVGIQIADIIEQENKLSLDSLFSASSNSNLGGQYSHDHNQQGLLMGYTENTNTSSLNEGNASSPLAPLAFHTEDFTNLNEETRTGSRPPWETQVSNAQGSLDSQPYFAHTDLTGLKQEMQHESAIQVIPALADQSAKRDINRKPKSKIGMSIKDLLDSTEPESDNNSKTTKSPKRKADNISTSLEETAVHPVETPINRKSIQIMSKPEHIETNKAATISNQEEIPSGSMENPSSGNTTPGRNTATAEVGERPRKRIKHSHGATKMQIATSALAGAVAGGIGMFAALAFLPESMFQ